MCSQLSDVVDAAITDYAEMEKARPIGVSSKLNLLQAIADKKDDAERIIAIFQLNKDKTIEGYLWGGSTLKSVIRILTLCVHSMENEHYSFLLGIEKRKLIASKPIVFNTFLTKAEQFISPPYWRRGDVEKKDSTFPTEDEFFIKRLQQVHSFKEEIKSLHHAYVTEQYQKESLQNDVVRLTEEKIRLEKVLQKEYDSNKMLQEELQQAHKEAKRQIEEWKFILRNETQKLRHELTKKKNEIEALTSRKENSKSRHATEGEFASIKQAYDSLSGHTTEPVVSSLIPHSILTSHYRSDKRRIEQISSANTTPPPSTSSRKS